MNLIFFRFVFISCILLAAVFGARAQTLTPGVNASNDKSEDSKEDLPKNVKETLAKGRIDREKKDYEELIQRSEEVLKISNELDKSFTGKNKFSTDDEKKLDRLEKLVKKIRSELGGNDDDNYDQNETTSMSAAIKSLQETTANLVDVIKKSTRYSVSVAAIESSNTLLKIVRFIRFGN